jgi:hypothetical protein
MDSDVSTVSRRDGQPLSFRHPQRIHARALERGTGWRAVSSRALEVSRAAVCWSTARQAAAFSPTTGRCFLPSAYDTLLPAAPPVDPVSAVPAAPAAMSRTFPESVPRFGWHAWHSLSSISLGCPSWVGASHARGARAPRAPRCGFAARQRRSCSRITSQRQPRAEDRRHPRWPAGTDG